MAQIADIKHFTKMLGNEINLAKSLMEVVQSFEEGKAETMSELDALIQAANELRSILEKPLHHPLETTSASEEKPPAEVSVLERRRELAAGMKP